MQCPNCGNLLAQGDQFCGICGFHLGSNMPTLLSQRRATSFHSAPTVAGLDIATAMTAVENPYHLLIPSLNMTSLIINDDRAEQWSENRYMGSQSSGKAWYESVGVFHLKGNYIGAYLAQASRIKDFTFQALIEFHQVATGQKSNELGITYIRPGENQWYAFVNLLAKSEIGDKTLWVQDSYDNMYDLRLPSYKPFLLG